jgi:hypothetical protein
MAAEGRPAIERLRAFLRELKPEARTLLTRELERGLLRGDGMAGAEMVLAELRRSGRDRDESALHFGEPARLFFRPIEPFVVDDAADRVHRGRIARAALEPIWLWINNALMPEEARAYGIQVEEALGAGDTGAVEHLVRSFQDRVVRRIPEMLADVGRDDKERRRLITQIGTPRALDDVKTVRGILDARDGLAVLGGKLPDHIRDLSGARMEAVKALIDSPLGAKSDLFLYSLVLLMGRLAAPWQLIRLATRAAGGDDVARIAETPYALAVDIVLDEIERRVRELGADLKSGRGIAVGALLKDIHDAVRGLRTELDLSGESSWGRRLAATRAEISSLLSAEIELMPGRVRRLLRPRPANEISGKTMLDPDEVAEAEALVGFVVACRNYAGELAINEVTQRSFGELQKCLDTGTRTLLDALRTANVQERPFRQSQVDAAVRFCGKVFGQEYAALLAKAAEVAFHGGERKTAAHG